MIAVEIILVIIAIVGLIVLTVFAIARRREHLSGEYGERKTNELLCDLQTPDDEIISDYIASRNKSNTASIQIDHIFITRKGVFVIETKDYRGRIYGSRNQSRWTQVLAYGQVKNRLYNPIKQNETHCKYIGRLLDWKYPIYNAVVFIKADTSRVTDSQGVLFSPYSFGMWYRSLPASNAMTSNSIQFVKRVLLDEMSKNRISKEEHIRNVNRNH